jgi:hypothetical protein
MHIRLRPRSVEPVFAGTSVDFISGNPILCNQLKIMARPSINRQVNFDRTHLGWLGLSYSKLIFRI